MNSSSGNSMPSKVGSSHSNSKVVKLNGQEFTFENESDFAKWMYSNGLVGNFTPESSMGSPAKNIDGDDVQAEPSSEPARNVKKRRNRAKCWNLFDKDYEKQIATCRICSLQLSHHNGSGTGSLTRHFKNHPGWEEDGFNISQQQLQRSGTGQVENWHYSQKKAREFTARYVVQKELPFSFTEDPAFESYVQNALQPQFKRIPRSTLYNDGMRLFQEDVELLKGVFNSSTCKFSLTSDLWTGRCNLSYMCVTAHWVDDDWIMQKRIIDFVELPHPHTGQEIDGQMVRTLNFWYLKEKSLSFSFDNVSNNGAAVRLLKTSLKPILGGSLFHVGCVCHIIHLCVKDGLNHITGSIEQIRSFLSHITSSSTRTQKYRELVELNGKKYCYPYLVCKIRWNSTFRMLQGCRKYADEIIACCSDFIVGKDELDPADNYLKMNDFYVVDVLGPLLQKFKEVSEVMSGQFYPTSNLMLAYMVHITKLFFNLKNDPLLGDVIQGMLEKWLKYFSTVPTIAILIACLDPRCKIDGCVLLLKMYYTNIGNGSAFGELVEKDRIQRMFDTLYDAYNDACPVEETSGSQTNNQQGRGLFGSLRGNKSNQSVSNQTNVNEVLYFFGACQHPDSTGFNVLHWWRDDAKSFPILRRIDRDLLASQMSTVASESCFSAAGRTLTDKRSRLTPKSIRFCVMWKDMLDAEIRIKEQKYKSCYEDDEDDIFLRGYFVNEEDFVPEEETPTQTLGTYEKQDFLADYFDM